MKTTLIKLLVSAWGCRKHFDTIVAWIVAHDEAISSGSDKFEMILMRINAAQMAAKVDWTTRTVVQLCYAYARLTKQIKRA